MSTRLKVAIVGAGGWGYQHARILAARPDVELCAIAGRTREKTAARAAEFHARPYTSVDEMLAKEKPDFVTLSLPNREHFDATMRVITAGVPLLVEKPLTFELSEADQLVAEAQRRNLFFAINFNHRYAKPVVMAHQAIRQGRLGELIFASWRFGGEGGVEHPFNNLIETQCHGFDMLEFLCGPIVSIMAQMTDKTHHGVYRTMALALQFNGGAVGTLLGSYDSSYAYPDTHVVEINGTKGRVRIEDTVQRYTFNASGNEIAETWQAGYFNDRDRGFHLTFDAHMDAMLAAFRRREQPPIHARAGRRALRLALAAIDSFRSGRRVEIPPDDYIEMPSPKITTAPPSP